MIGCAAGFAYANGRCEACPVGTYGAGGTAACTPCVSRFTTAGNGTTSSAGCNRERSGGAQGQHSSPADCLLCRGQVVAFVAAVGSHMKAGVWTWSWREPRELEPSGHARERTQLLLAQHIPQVDELLVWGAACAHTPHTRSPLYSKPQTHVAGCMPGYGGSSCLACPKRSWSPGAGKLDKPECTQCPRGWTTLLTASNSSSACNTCGAGFGGASCALCAPGTYSAGGNATYPTRACTACSVGINTTDVGSGASAACTSAGAGSEEGKRGPAEGLGSHQWACGALSEHGRCPVAAFVPCAL